MSGIWDLLQAYLWLAFLLGARVSCLKWHFVWPACTLTEVGQTGRFSSPVLLCHIVVVFTILVRNSCMPVVSENCYIFLNERCTYLLCRAT
ncbi:hypothetical protein EJ08DRAFT_93172 [Tothia fuscella]|uniref:Uncharacterized protein n=1 Tax=Tothia fuscella TaxID=1048955 RepID=A0A9P4NXU5_9PEZI|nr:hypothetical protein EJ08DRAFT_93172 [Tothia fuscella]